MTDPLLEVRGLSVRFSRGATTFNAVDSVHFSLARHETLGVVGGSGSGKSTLARAILQLVPKCAGTIRFDGQEIGVLHGRALRAYYQQVQMVLEMERKLFDSLKIGSLSCDMLIEDKEINDQTIRMELEFALKELVATLQPDSTELEQLPESCKLSMEIHSLIQQRNEEFAIEMPDLSQAVSVE